MMILNVVYGLYHCSEIKVNDFQAASNSVP